MFAEDVFLVLPFNQDTVLILHIRNDMQVLEFVNFS